MGERVDGWVLVMGTGAHAHIERPIPANVSEIPDLLERVCRKLRLLQEADSIPTVDDVNLSITRISKLRDERGKEAIVTRSFLRGHRPLVRIPFKASGREQRSRTHRGHVLASLALGDKPVFLEAGAKLVRAHSFGRRAKRSSSG